MKNARVKLPRRSYSGPPSQNQGLYSQWTPLTKSGTEFKLARSWQKKTLQGFKPQKSRPTYRGLDRVQESSPTSPFEEFHVVKNAQMKLPRESYSGPLSQNQGQGLSYQEAGKRTTSLPFEDLSRKRVDPDWTVSNCPQQ